MLLLLMTSLITAQCARRGKLRLSVVVVVADVAAVVVAVDVAVAVDVVDAAVWCWWWC